MCIKSAETINIFKKYTNKKNFKMDVNQNEIETINENINENAKKLILELIRKEEEEEEEEEKKNDRIEFIQEAFNVMVLLSCKIVRIVSSLA